MWADVKREGFTTGGQLTDYSLGQKGNGGVLRFRSGQHLLVVLVHKLDAFAEGAVLLKHVAHDVVGGFAEVLDAAADEVEVAAGLLGDRQQVVLAFLGVDEHGPGDGGFDLQEADAVAGLGGVAGEDAFGALVEFEGFLLYLFEHALDVDALLLFLFVFELFDKVFACVCVCVC